jgi:zinc/manganese transport system ATP-binding protein
VNAVEFHAVSISYGSRRVISDVSFSIPQGRFVGVLGPNGAGKSTLMRTILGLAAPSSGRVAVLGQAPRRGNPAIGYMPQSRHGVAHLRLNGYELVLGALGGNRWGWPFASRKDKAAAWAALDRVGAMALAGRPVCELSGGERQRLLIAQALIGAPQLLLLDEPLISLDPNHQRAIVELTRDIGRDLGIAVLFCAHEINPLLRALDMVLYLGNGRAAVGDVDAVVNRHVLSDLYRTPIHVSRLNGRIFVMAEDGELESHGHDDV